MTILKTYARVWPTDLEAAVSTYEQLTGRREHLRFAFESVVIVGIGDFLLIAGPREAQEGYREASATVVVDDLASTLRELATDVSVVSGPTGSFAYVGHADGSFVEYVEWADDYRREAARRGAFERRPAGDLTPS